MKFSYFIKSEKSKFSGTSSPKAYCPNASHIVSEAVDMSSLPDWVEQEKGKGLGSSVGSNISAESQNWVQINLGNKAEKELAGIGGGETPGWEFDRDKILKSSCVYPRSSQHIVLAGEGARSDCILGRSRWGKYSFKCLTEIQNHSWIYSLPHPPRYAWKWSCFGMVCLAPLNF